MPQQTVLTRERWCPRCDDYTEQTRDAHGWRRSSILSALAFPYTILEDLGSNWFCETCRRNVHPFWHRSPSGPSTE